MVEFHVITTWFGTICSYVIVCAIFYLCNASYFLLKHNCFLYILYIWIGTIIVELMGILCFYWDIFMYIARTRKIYADGGCRTPFGFWVCWTYMLLMIVLNYFGCQWPTTFVYCRAFFLTMTWILEHNFIF